MAQATNMTQWLDELVEAAEQGRVASTSAGAGPERQYAYLHYRTVDDQHSVLVLFHTEEDGEPSVLAFRFDGDDDQIAERVWDATRHGPPA